MPITKPYRLSSTESIKLISLTLSLFILTNCANNANVFNSENDNNSELIVPANLSDAKINNTYAIVNKATIDPQNQLQSNLVQNGKQIWLELNNQDLSSIVPLMQSYIKNLGLTIALQDTNIARIQTNWATTHNKITDKSGVRYIFDKIGLGKMYSLPSKYRFIINLWQDQGMVKVFVTVEQANEEYLTGHAPENNRSPSETQQTKWVMLAPKLQNEINFLSNFVTFANTNQIIANNTESNIASVASPQASLQDNTIVINTAIDPAFDKTLASLDKANLGVVSIDKNNYQIIVYPLPTNATVANDDSWFNKIFSRKAKSSNDHNQYIIKLMSNDDSTTSLTLSNYSDDTKESHNIVANPTKITNYLKQLLAQLQ